MWKYAFAFLPSPLGSPDFRFLFLTRHLLQPLPSEIETSSTITELWHRRTVPGFSGINSRKISRFSCEYTGLFPDKRLCIYWIADVFL